MDLKNAFQYINSQKKEVFTEIFNSKSVKIEQINSPHQPLGSNIWYNQNHTEIIILLEGKASIEFDNLEIVNLEKGDYYKIEKNHKHRVAYSSANPECIWLAIHIKE